MRSYHCSGLEKDCIRIRWHVHFEPGQVGSGTVSVQSLKTAWQEINQKLWERLFAVLGIGLDGAAQCGVEEDFEREPHRNRFTVLLGRTVHLAYHVGQATLAAAKSIV